MKRRGAGQMGRDTGREIERGHHHDGMNRIEDRARETDRQSHTTLARPRRGKRQRDHDVADTDDHGIVQKPPEIALGERAERAEQRAGQRGSEQCAGQRGAEQQCAGQRGAERTGLAEQQLGAEQRRRATERSDSSACNRLITRRASVFAELHSALAKAGDAVQSAIGALRNEHFVFNDVFALVLPLLVDMFGWRRTSGSTRPLPALEMSADDHRVMKFLALVSSVKDKRSLVAEMFEALGHSDALLRTPSASMLAPPLLMISLGNDAVPFAQLSLGKKNLLEMLSAHADVQLVFGHEYTLVGVVRRGAKLETAAAHRRRSSSDGRASHIVW